VTEKHFFIEKGQKTVNHNFFAYVIVHKKTALYGCLQIWFFAKYSVIVVQNAENRQIFLTKVQY
jgi:hypothetical protein